MNKKQKQDQFCYLDFEFNDTTEELVNLVSCVVHDGRTKKTTKFWLHNSESEKKRLAEHLTKYQIIIGYACVAEARSFISLNLDPLYFKWVDLFLEYRLLTNHYDKLQWGEQLVDGKVRKVFKPLSKWERTEDDAKNGFRATHSLAEATFKLTGEIRDTEEKNKTRELIISAPKKFTKEEREQILKYNAVDVEFLPRLWKRVKEEIVEFCGGEDNIDMNRYYEEAFIRGRYSAHTALMESRGYPINVDATKNFSRQIPSILSECQRDINHQFCGNEKVAMVTERLTGKPSNLPFRFNKKTATYSWDQKVAREWLKANVDTKKWMRTDASKKHPNGQLSLALEAWERVFQFKHDYPRGHFGAQIVRFLKLKQSLYGFSDTNGKRKNFWDSVGRDGRVRPYMNIYGAQSSRSQPAANGFMFLKPAWMRALVQPAPGYYLAGVDYGQQEFFLSGLESEDKNMIAAYLSGDPYLYGAKLAGAIPQDGTKESHKLERDTFKNTYLGILFGMTKYGLAVKLTNDLGRTYTEDEAQEQIDLFEETYPDYMDWKRDLLDTYQNGEGIKLPCIGSGTLIPTIRGSKPIEQITKEDIVWDGNQWCSQDGIVQKGVKDVIRDNGAGITATPDHLVLIDGVWLTWGQVVLEGYQRHLSDKNSEPGKLLVVSSTKRAEGMSLVAAYVNLKWRLESNNCKVEELRPVLDALNLDAPRTRNAGDLAKFLVTNILSESGELASRTLKEDALERQTRGTSNDITLVEYVSASTLFEFSWNTFLSWMGIRTGTRRSTALTMTDITSLETYESSVKKLITGTSEVYDILNSGPKNRFQAGAAIVHNCGWMMGPDNDNPRSAMNVPIQGMGASIMRKAVDLAVSRGCRVIFTLHDAIYIEDKIGNEHKIGVLMECMREAFQFYYKNTNLYETAGKIKLDPFAWSPDFPEPKLVKNSKGKEVREHATIKVKVGKETEEIEVSNLYIDERSLPDYQRFSRYFETPDTDLL